MMMIMILSTSVAVIKEGFAVNLGNYTDMKWTSPVANGPVRTHPVCPVLCDYQFINSIGFKLIN